MNTDEQVVHVLWHGRAICGEPGIPRDWPPNHRWVAISEWSALANCTGCRAQAPELAAAQAQRAAVIAGE